ncbi:MAG: type II toxin-antitoxin system VapC family toxin [Thermoproteota archaeon]
MYLVDTNIFLEVMLSQARSKECEVFLKSVKEGVSKAFITDFSIYSIMIIMTGLSKLGELKVFLSSLSAYKGLAIHCNGLKDLLRAVETMREKHLDLDDAIQYSVAMSLGVKAIVSFDKHFDGLEVPRAEPAQLV